LAVLFAGSEGAWSPNAQLLLQCSNAYGKATNTLSQDIRNSQLFWVVFPKSYPTHPSRINGSKGNVPWGGDHGVDLVRGEGRV